MENWIIVLGATGTGIQMAASVERSPHAEFYGFLDDDPAKQAQGFRGYPVLGGLSSWTDQPDDYLFVTSLYGAKKNRSYAEIVGSLGIPDRRWGTVVDSSAVVSRMAVIGMGSYVGPCVVVQPTVQIGHRCSLLGNVYIGHDCRIDDYVLVANSVSVNGYVSVGEGTYLGANSTIRERLTIGRFAIVGQGAVVTHDVGDLETVVGNPARKLKEYTGEREFLRALQGGQVTAPPVDPSSPRPVATSQG